MESMVMLGINDHAAAMCECGDYITYYSNMEMAIFFFSSTNAQGWNHECVTALCQKELWCFSLCVVNVKRPIKHCLEWWRPHINDAVWSLLLITALHSSPTESCYWVINNEDGIKALGGLMCLILMSFCSLLKISDIRPVLHSVEFIPGEPLEKFPTHSSNTISVVIILPL